MVWEYREYSEAGSEPEEGFHPSFNVPWLCCMDSWFSPLSHTLERSSSSKCWRWEYLLPSSPNLLQSQRVGMIPVESFDPLQYRVLVLAVYTSPLLPDPRQGEAKFPWSLRGPCSLNSTRLSRGSFWGSGKEEKGEKDAVSFSLPCSQVT